VASDAPADVIVRCLDFTDPGEVEALYDLRYRVLREPLGLPRGSERIAQDPEPTTTHLGAFNDASPLIGCATLIENDGLQLRAMAVARDWQGRGVGSAVLRAAAEIAADRPLWCEARVHAVGFYAQADWTVEGDVFDVPDIGPHYRMRRAPIAPVVSPPDAAGSHPAVTIAASPRHLFEAVGGVDGCRRLVTAFYARVGDDPVLAPLYPKSFHCAIPSLTGFLIQFLGGPQAYTPRRFHLSLRDAHARFRIGRVHQEAWLRNMLAALDDAGIAEPAREALEQLFAESSEFLINEGSASPAAPQPDAQVALPATAPLDLCAESGWRWARHRAVEAVLRAVRHNEVRLALALVDSPTVAGYRREDRAAWMSLLAILGAHGSADLLAFVERALHADPVLVTDRYAHGQTLLHDAAAGWAPEFTALLLTHGADANAVDNAGHTPLYEAADAVGLRADRRIPEDGSAVVRLLARNGAALDATCGVRRCTALHMAARRDNAAIAAALLDLGAAPDLPDRLGDTPLRRAVICGQPEVAALLLAHGADRNSIGSGGLTVTQAARGERMASLLRG
jgi:hemoglobin